MLRVTMEWRTQNSTTTAWWQLRDKIFFYFGNSTIHVRVTEPRQVLSTRDVPPATRCTVIRRAALHKLLSVSTSHAPEVCCRLCSTCQRVRAVQMTESGETECLNCGRRNLPARWLHKQTVYLHACDDAAASSGGSLPPQRKRGVLHALSPVAKLTRSSSTK